MAQRGIKSPAKKQVIDFIKTAVMDEDYTFVVQGNVSDAQEFVHRMRVELSRLRGLLREMGKVAKHFKMMHIKDAHDAAKGVTKVTLKKTTSASDVTEAVSDALSDLSAGDMINVEAK